MEILQTDDELVIRAAMPGFTPEDLGVVVLSGVLSLKGEHKVVETPRPVQYPRQTGATASGSTTATVTSHGCSVADWAIGSGSHVPAIVWTIAQP